MPNYGWNCRVMGWNFRAMGWNRRVHCALWNLIRKYKISGQYLHTLLRYGNLKKFGFLNRTTLFSYQLFSNLNWIKLRTGKLRNIIIFEISQLVRELYAKEDFLTVLFSTIFHYKFAKNCLIMIEQFCFFPWKLRHRAFRTC